MRRVFAFVLAASLVCAVPSGAVASAAATNLVQNPGFESPVVAAGTGETFATGTSFSHWNVVGDPGNVSVVSGSFTDEGFTFPAKSGVQWLDLTGNGSNTATGVAQTVTTTNGLGYTLKFAVGNVVDSSGVYGTSSTVKVYIDGALKFTAVNSDGTGSTAEVWKSFSFNFTAPSASTTIEFLNGDPPNDNLNGLDAISLTAGP